METVVQGEFGAPTAYIQKDGALNKQFSRNLCKPFTTPTSSFSDFIWPFFPTSSITHALHYLRYVADSLTRVFLHLTLCPSTHSKYPPGRLATQDYLRNVLSNHKKLYSTLFPETASFPLSTE